jgi:hypothetical protein
MIVSSSKLQGEIISRGVMHLPARQNIVDLNPSG